MKQLFFKIASFSLALIVLFSTFSFTVEKHYCGEFLMDVSFTGDADDCGMEMEAIASTKKKNCCKDEVQHIEGQDELHQNSIDEFDFEKESFLTSFIVSYQTLFSTTSSEKPFQKDFRPPDISFDYQVKYQRFLI